MSPKRRTVGGENDPLGYLDKPSKGPRRSPPELPTTKGPKKMRATFHIPTDLFDQVRNAVYALSGPPNRLTLATFAERALRAELERVKGKENKGRAFPRRGEELKGGRPLKV